MGRARARRGDDDLDAVTVERAPVWPIDTRLVYAAVSFDVRPVLGVLPTV